MCVKITGILLSLSLCIILDCPESFSRFTSKYWMNTFFVLYYLGWFMYSSFVLLKQRKETFETIFILLPLLLYVSMLNL